MAFIGLAPAYLLYTDNNNTVHKTLTRRQKIYGVMTKAAQLIHKTVFLSVNNPLNQMADSQAWVRQLCARAGASSVTGMALAAHDRWLCMLEGELAQVVALEAAIKRRERPKHWVVLMTNPRARERMFPQHRVGWSNDATPLEMVAFLSDLRRHSSRSQVWHISVEDAAPLCESDAN